MPPNTRWKLKIQTEIQVKEIVVDSSGASNGISINTTGGGSTEGISVEQLPDEGEFELHKSFEESGKSNSSTQLVCSGQFSTEKKPSKWNPLLLFFTFIRQKFSCSFLRTILTISFVSSVCSFHHLAKKAISTYMKVLLGFLCSSSTTVSKIYWTPAFWMLLFAEGQNKKQGIHFFG